MFLVEASGMAPLVSKILTFRHHAEVSALDRHEADQLLDWAERAINTTGKPRSTGELRNEIASRKRAKHAAPFTPVVGERVTLRQGDCIERIAELPDDSVDMALTSPPYGKLREYGGNWKFNMSALGAQVFRVLKSGGVAVVVIGDPIEDGEQRIDSHRLVVDWVDNASLKLFQPLIFHRNGIPGQFYPHFRL